MQQIQLNIIPLNPPAVKQKFCLLHGKAGCLPACRQGRNRAEYLSGKHT